MNNRDVIVRIVQPADKPQPKMPPVLGALPENKRDIFHHRLANVFGIIGIFAAGAFLTVSFFHLGINLHEVMVMVGIPLSVGLVTSYAVL